MVWATAGGVNRDRLDYDDSNVVVNSGYDRAESNIGELEGECITALRQKGYCSKRFITSKENLFAIVDRFLEDGDIKKITVKEIFRYKTVSSYSVQVEGKDVYPYIWAYKNSDSSYLSGNDLLTFEKAQKLVKEAEKYHAEYEKEGFFHDYLVANIAYTKDENWDSFGQTAYGALVLNKCVCAGYASAFQLLLSMSGIDCYYVSGTATNSDGVTGGHAWNKVKIDGYWYNVDVTWDDPVPDVPGRVMRRYFNVTDEVLAKNHAWDNSGLPECTQINPAVKRVKTIVQVENYVREARNKGIKELYFIVENSGTLPPQKLYSAVSNIDDYFAYETGGETIHCFILK